MRFVATGQLTGSSRIASVQWEDGRLSGDAGAVALALLLATTADPVGPPEGPYTERDHLQDPLSAIMLIRDLFQPGTVSVEGDIPTRPAIPEGAIG